VHADHVRVHPLAECISARSAVPYRFRQAVELLVDEVREMDAAGFPGTGTFPGLPVPLVR
jgi:hypothetical protein